MDYQLDTGGEIRLKRFMDGIGEVLGEPRRRASFATYAMGLWGDGERKSMEPMAARAAADPDKTDAGHQRLLHFISDSAWDDHGVRRKATTYGLKALTTREPITGWVLDDTGFLKQGKHSVGVQRQYTGSAGKITNCQIGVSLSVFTPTEHLPIDFELYLPHSWSDDPVRRREARIPDGVVFQTKPELAMAMLRRAVADGVAKGVVLADSAYGHSSSLRRTCRELGLPYAVGIMPTDRVLRLDRLGRRTGRPVTVKNFAAQLGRSAFRRITWREGSKQKLWSRFAMERVVMAKKDGAGDREEVWLLMEWEEGEPSPTKYTVASLSPSISRKRLVRTVKQRWRTERVYQDLKGELGLDHFEGRRFRGWHHHVSVALCCFAFVVAERASAFSPSARSQGQNRANQRQARAPLRRFFHHGQARDRAGNRHVASSLSPLPPPPIPAEIDSPFTAATTWCSCAHGDGGTS